MGALDPGALEAGSLVIQDDVVLSRRFLRAFVRAVPDPKKNYRCGIDASRFPLLSPHDPAPSFRRSPVSYYGDPTRAADAERCG